MLKVETANYDAHLQHKIFLSPIMNSQYNVNPFNAHQCFYLMPTMLFLFNACVVPCDKELCIHLAKLNHAVELPLFILTDEFAVVFF